MLRRLKKSCQLPVVSCQPAGRGGVPNESRKIRTPPRRVAGGFIGQLILAAVVGIAPLAAGVLPDRLAGAMKSDVKPVAAPDPALFEEYGFEEGEQAAFGPTTILAWRFHDTTGAMSAFEYVRPADAKPIQSTLHKMAASTSKG